MCEIFSCLEACKDGMEHIFALGPIYSNCHFHRIAASTLTGLEIFLLDLVIGLDTDTRGK